MGNVRRPCTNCAYHRHVRGLASRRRNVIKHIINDNVAFFEKRFVKMEFFHCGVMNLYIYLIAYSSYRIMDLIARDYPRTNRRNKSCAFHAILALFGRKKLRDNLSQTMILQLFERNILQPHQTYFGDCLFARILSGDSLFLITSCLLNLYPRRPISVNCRTSLTFDIFDALRENHHNVFIFHRPFIKMRVYVCQKDDNDIEFKLVSFSYKILALYFMMMCGFRFELEYDGLEDDDIHQECVNILNTFEMRRRNLDLFTLCRRTLLQSAPTYNSLRDYVNIYSINSMYKEFILMNNIDIISDAKHLGMLTFVKRYSERPQLLYRDHFMTCMCCKKPNDFHPDQVFYWL